TDPAASAPADPAPCDRTDPAPSTPAPSAPAPPSPAEPGPVVAPGGGPPGRISRSAARSSACTAVGRPWGRTPPAARCSARLGSGQSTVSWPPKTREDSGGRPQSAKSAVSVTMPVGGWSPAATAAQPVMAVVATDPRAPMSQTPKRAAGGGVGRNGSADMGSLLVVREPGVSRRRRGRAGAGPLGARRDGGRRSGVLRPPPFRSPFGPLVRNRPDQGAGLVRTE